MRFILIFSVLFLFLFLHPRLCFFSNLSHLSLDLDSSQFLNNAEQKLQTCYRETLFTESCFPLSLEKKLCTTGRINTQFQNCKCTKSTILCIEMCTNFLEKKWNKNIFSWKALSRKITWNKRQNSNNWVSLRSRDSLSWLAHAVDLWPSSGGWTEDKDMNTKCASQSNKLWRKETDRRSNNWATFADRHAPLCEISHWLGAAAAQTSWKIRAENSHLV